MNSADVELFKFINQLSCGLFIPFVSKSYSAMAIFNKLTFNVNEKIFFELFKHPDKGFGFRARLDKDELTEIQIETLDFLVRCHKKRLMGAFTIIFKTDGIGEITELNRHVEKIEFKKHEYIISNTY